MIKWRFAESIGQINLSHATNQSTQPKEVSKFKLWTGFKWTNWYSILISHHCTLRSDCTSNTRFMTRTFWQPNPIYLSFVMEDWRQEWAGDDTRHQYSHVSGYQVWGQDVSNNRTQEKFSVQANSSSTECNAQTWEWIIKSTGHRIPNEPSRIPLTNRWKKLREPKNRTEWAVNELLIQISNVQAALTNCWSIKNCQPVQQSPYNSYSIIMVRVLCDESVTELRTEPLDLWVGRVG